ncbi:MAG: hypothetical protein ACXWDI_08760 [Nocardioides sp.]
MITLDVGTWHVDHGIPPEKNSAAISGVWSAHPELHVLALQEVHDLRLEPPDGVGAFHPDSSEGEDDNALMWSTARLELLDAYPLRLSEAGWRIGEGGRANRRVSPIVLFRDLVDGSRHAVASVHLSASLEADSVCAEALQSLGNHADALRRLGFRVHVGGDWGVDALMDDGERGCWPEATVGDLLRSAWRSCEAGPDPGTYGDTRRMVDDWRSTADAETVHAFDAGPSAHRLVVARLITG